LEHQELTGKIIACAYTVYNRLGYGFLESVYEKCMVLELRKAGLGVVEQLPLKVWYDNVIVGEFTADLLVGDTVIVELKSVRNLSLAHEVQLVNYLVATQRPIGLLLNFGEERVEIRRKLRTLPTPSRCAGPRTQSG